MPYIYFRDTTLANVQGDLLRPPLERDRDVPSQSFCSESDRLSTLNDRLHYVGRQEGQADQSTYIADVKSLACSDLSE